MTATQTPQVSDPKPVAVEGQDVPLAERGVRRGVELVALHLGLGFFFFWLSFFVWASRVHWALFGNQAPTVAAVKVVFYVCLVAYAATAVLMAYLWWTRRLFAWLPSIAWFVLGLVAVVVVLVLAQPAGRA
jgi:hypothetical protein